MSVEHQRCPWPTRPLDIAYHDAEWGVPVHDDHVRFEFLTLEGAQAGLSWSTVLARREHYRRAFADWDIERVAHFTPRIIERLVVDEGLIRHRGKIESTVSNAKAMLRVQHEFGSFDTYVWRFVGGTPRVNHFESMKHVPARTAQSEAMSTDLLARGFKFVGATICYAYMQATGMVNDHLVSCPRHHECAELT